MQLRHALIVDDSRTSAALLGKMLARNELSSDQVVSGESCLSYLAGSSPDIIFMDHMMPGMDGFEAVKAIKQQARLAAIPIVMYTSKGGDMYIGQARALGAVGVLQKPAAEQDVVDTLQMLRTGGSEKQPVPTVGSQVDPMHPVPELNNARLVVGSEPSLPGWASAREAVANDCRAGRRALRHALVVDDSRTSAALLGKMLARQGLSSDKVISGEDCLSYLASAHPDIIFMDHMMPGMDGFEAVKAIKRQSRLAAIPIVMHTSKGGDMYIGQARALGAVGVLEKPACEHALRDIIAELQPAPAAPYEPGDGTGTTVAASAALTQPPFRGTLLPGEAANSSYMPTGDSSRSRRQRQRLRRRSLLAGVVALLAVALIFWLGADEEPVFDQPALLDSLSRLGNQQAQYGFGEIPFDDQRAEVVQQLLRILELAGIEADIELRAHVGEFCRVYTDTGQPALPGPALPIEQCDMIGYEAAEAQALANSQSLNFRLLLEKLQSSRGQINVKLVPVGIFEPVVAYPPDTEIVMAGDWNRIASRNQRVELILRPHDAAVR